MTTRDELRQWVDDIPDGVLTPSLHKTINAVFARRVLAEMDEAKDEAQRWKERWQEAVRHADEAFAERDAALAKLDAIRALKTKRPRLFGRMQWEPILSILDGEGSEQ